MLFLFTGIQVNLLHRCNYQEWLVFNRATICQKLAIETLNDKVTTWELRFVAAKHYASSTLGSAKSKMAVKHTMMMIHRTLSTSLQNLTTAPRISKRSFNQDSWAHSREMKIQLHQPVRNLLIENRPQMRRLFNTSQQEYHYILSLHNPNKKPQWSFYQNSLWSWGHSCCYTVRSKLHWAWFCLHHTTATMPAMTNATRKAEYWRTHKPSHLLRQTNRERKLLYWVKLNGLL